MATTINGVLIQDRTSTTLTGATTTPTGTSALTVTRLGAYTTGNGDNSAEVFTYDSATKRLFVINNDTDQLEYVDFSNPALPVKVSSVDLAALPNYGGVNSVAVSNGRIAVAIEHVDGSSNGLVAFYSTTTGALQGTVAVGVLPDMVTFTPDGSRLIVANEGERDTQGTATTADDFDPAGSISIINLSGGVAGATAQTLGFGALDTQAAALRAAGVRLTPGREASTDIEPEYITLSADGRTAYVTLQEANSIGIFDVSGAAPVLKTIAPLGYVDHSLPGNEGDYSDQDTPGASTAGLINIHSAPIRGLLMPDSIASFTVGGITYLATANEGDARSDDSDTARLSSIDLNNNVFGANETTLRNNDNAGRLNISTIDGDTNSGVAGLEEIYTFGGRGITLFRVEPDGTLTAVRDTGGEFEDIIAGLAPTLFNNNQTANASTFDTRSDDKAAEPEAITVANVGGRHYAFVGLERQGGVMVYDVTDPANAKFVTYVSPTTADNGPEIVRYIAPVDSPNGAGLLLTSNEISGTVTVYQVVGAKSPLDFNGDAGSDILWRNDNGQVGEWLLNGAALTSTSLGSVGKDWKIADAADFDGDGKSDILWRNDNGQAGLWRMDGSTVLSTHSLGFVGNDWKIAGAGDFGGDGKADILWRNDNGQVSVWQMNGAQTVSAQNVSAVVGKDWHLAGIQDFNGDGKDDLVWRNDTGQVGIWHMNGAAQTNQSLGVVGRDWHIAGTGDFDGNGKGDLLWRNDNGKVDVWLTDGTNVILRQNVGSAGNDWHIEDTGDYNFDGKSDILWRNDTGQVGEWLLNGAQLLSAPSVAVASNDWHIAANHFDFI